MQTRLSLILAASILTACGGGSSDGDSGAGTTAGASTAGSSTSGSVDTGNTGGTGGSSVDQIGIIDVDQLGFDGFVSNIELSAGFISSSSLINPDFFTSQLKPSSDVCNVQQDVPVSGQNDPDFLGINNSDIRTISAGETITFTSPEGTYATLNREVALGFTGYSLELDGNNTVPAGLTVDIPGDEFPAFSNVAVPAVASLTGLIISTGELVNSSSTITWDGTPDSGSTISISVYSEIDFANILTSTRTEVECVVVDDGSFSFPAAIQAQMGSLSTFDYYIGRNNVKLLMGL